MGPTVQTMSNPAVLDSPMVIQDYPQPRGPPASPIRSPGKLASWRERTWHHQSNTRRKSTQTFHPPPSPFALPSSEQDKRRAAEHLSRIAAPAQVVANRLSTLYMNTFPRSETDGEHDDLPSKPQEYCICGRRHGAECRQQKVNQRNEIELTEVVSLGKLIRPSIFRPFFNLGEQRVAALERQT